MKYSKAGYLSCLPCHILSPTLCIAHQCYHCRRRRRALFCIVIACYKIHVFELSKFLVNHEQQHFFLFWLNYVLSRLVNGKFDELNKTLEIIFVKQKMGQVHEIGKCIEVNRILREQIAVLKDVNYDKKIKKVEDYLKELLN